MQLTSHPTNIETYLRGERLYGEDLSDEEIRRWLESEREGVADLVDEYYSENKVHYEYHALNRRLAFAHLPDGRFRNALGFGAQFGREFEPIVDRIDHITILEPSDNFVVPDVGGHPVSYVKPNSDSSLPFRDTSFDLITCFGVLHHLPRVSEVLAEFYRCLRPGGYALVREPISSMGDWTHSRPGLTRNERGIPPAIFRRLVAEAGFEVVSLNRCAFAPFMTLGRLFKFEMHSSEVWVTLDQAACTLMSWNDRYHAVRPWEKLRAGMVNLVLRRAGVSN